MFSKSIQKIVKKFRADYKKKYNKTIDDKEMDEIVTTFITLSDIIIEDEMLKHRRKMEQAKQAG